MAQPARLRPRRIVAERFREQELIAIRIRAEVVVVARVVTTVNALLNLTEQPVRQYLEGFISGMAQVALEEIAKLNL